MQERDFDPKVGGGVDRDKLKDSDFVFPDERVFPVVTPGDVRDAISSWGRYRGPQSFATFKRRLIALCRRKGEKFVAQLPDDWTEGRLSNETVLLEGMLETRQARRDAEGRFRFEFVALRDNTLSSNRRFYGERFLDETIRRTNEQTARGNVLTIYSSHASATGGLFAPGPEKLPIGKIESLRRDGRDMVGEAVISPTIEGKDVQTLIEDGVVRPMSIRAYEYESEPAKMSVDGEELEVEDMKWAILAGIDFCDRPGIAGAGIKRVLEAAPTLEPLEEEEMALEEITMEQLRSERNDLVEALLAEGLQELAGQLEVAQAQIAVLQEREPEMAQQNEQLRTQVEALETSAADIRAKLSVYESEATPLVRALVKARQEHPQANPEEWRGIRNRVIQETLAEAGFQRGSDTPDKGQPDVGDPDYGKKPEQVPEDMATAVFGMMENVAYFARNR